MRKNIELLLTRINGTMALENMELTEGDKRLIRDCDNKVITVNQAISSIKSKYRNIV